MLPVTSVIVDYTFKNVFLTFYFRQAGPLKRHKACDNFDALNIDICSTGYYIEPTVIETKDPANILMREVRF